MTSTTPTEPEAPTLREWVALQAFNAMRASKQLPDAESIASAPSRQFYLNCADAIIARMLAGEGVTIPSHHAFEGDHSSLRLRFDTALAGMATINGDSGWIVHTNGHADDMERAIEVINELRAKLARPPALDKEEEQ